MLTGSGGTPMHEFLADASARHDRYIDTIPRGHLERARIVSRRHTYQGREMDEFMWVAKDTRLCCERCDYFYSPKDHIAGGVCPRVTGKGGGLDEDVTYCGGRIVPHYHFLESPSDRLEVYSRAVRWMNDGFPQDDQAGRRAHWLIFTFEGAQKRRPDILREAPSA